MLSRMNKLSDVEQVEALYQLADGLAAVEHKLNLWNQLDIRTQEALHAVIGSFDFMMSAKDIREMADEWQARIDREEAA